MKSTEKKLLISLIQDGVRGDVPSFEMRARRLASKLSKEDKDFANEINKCLLSSSVLRKQQHLEAQSTPVDSDTRLNLLIESYPVILEEKPIYTSDLNRSITRLIEERQRMDELYEAGMLPVRSILLEGPPGVGKTITAKWIASQLDLPLLTLDLATVMSSFLGKTGNNIRSVLKYAVSFPCVLLLDEFDAIAKKRDDDTDVGELKRLVTVLLQAIDEWPVTSLLIAATNHGELLDPAIFRRFDSRIEIPLPSQKIISQYLKSIELKDYAVDWLSENLQGQSLALIGKKVNQAKKASLIDGIPLMDALAEIFELEATPDSLQDKNDRDSRILFLHSQGLSQRKISEELGLSRPTIAKVIKENKGSDQDE